MSIKNGCKMYLMAALTAVAMAALAAGCGTTGTAPSGGLCKKNSDCKDGFACNEVGVCIPMFDFDWNELEWFETDVDLEGWEEACSETAQPQPQKVGDCQLWTCLPATAPACWQCGAAADPAKNGASCSDGELTGVCADGVCVTGGDVDAEIDLDDWNSKCGDVDNNEFYDAIQIVACKRQQCVKVDYPQCWSCSFVADPAQNGYSCAMQPPSGTMPPEKAGVCKDGECVEQGTDGDAEFIEGEYDTNNACGQMGGICSLNSCGDGYKQAAATLGLALCPSANNVCCLPEANVKCYQNGGWCVYEGSACGPGFGVSAAKPNGCEVFAETQCCVPTGTNCVLEGGRGQMGADDCCEGLTEIANSEATGDGSCVSTPDLSFVCAKCGDKTCGLGENFCNCPADCAKPGECKTDAQCPAPSCADLPTGMIRCAQTTYTCNATSGKCVSMTQNKDEQVCNQTTGMCSQPPATMCEQDNAGVCTTASSCPAGYVMNAVALGCSKNCCLRNDCVTANGYCTGWSSNPCKDGYELGETGGCPGGRSAACCMPVTKSICESEGTGMCVTYGKDCPPGYAANSDPMGCGESSGGIIAETCCLKSTCNAMGGNCFYCPPNADCGCADGTHYQDGVGCPQDAFCCVNDTPACLTVGKVGNPGQDKCCQGLTETEIVSASPTGQCIPANTTSFRCLKLGDGFCDAASGENWCNSNDCAKPRPCQAAKDCLLYTYEIACTGHWACMNGSCAEQCGLPCGDGKCNSEDGESTSTCWPDCQGECTVDRDCAIKTTPWPDIMSCFGRWSCDNAKCNARCDAQCGNGTCEPGIGENAQSCPYDCRDECNSVKDCLSNDWGIRCSGYFSCEYGKCLKNCGGSCGDNVCKPDEGETKASCPQDCNQCNTPKDCLSRTWDIKCMGYWSCDSNVCNQNCGGGCGDGWCDAEKGESEASCNVDCKPAQCQSNSDCAYCKTVGTTCYMYNDYCSGGACITGSVSSTANATCDSVNKKCVPNTVNVCEQNGGECYDFAGCPAGTIESPMSCGLTSGVCCVKQTTTACEQKGGYCSSTASCQPGYQRSSDSLGCASSSGSEGTCCLPSTQECQVPKDCLGRTWMVDCIGHWNCSNYKCQPACGSPCGDNICDPVKGEDSYNCPDCRQTGCNTDSECGRCEMRGTSCLQYKQQCSGGTCVDLSAVTYPDYTCNAATKTCEKPKWECEQKGGSCLNTYGCPIGGYPVSYACPASAPLCCMGGVAQCQIDSDCGTPKCESTSDGYCFESVPTCSNGACQQNEQTYMGYACSYTGRCQPLTTKCTYDWECGSQYCESVEGSASCRETYPTCNNGVCDAKGSDYPVPYVCNYNTGACEYPQKCQSDSECGSPSCFDASGVGSCIQSTPYCDPTSGTCQTKDSSFMPPYYCNYQNGYCETAQKCNSDSECGSPYCYDGDDGNCYSVSYYCSPDGMCGSSEGAEPNAKCDYNTNQCVSAGLTCDQAGGYCARRSCNNGYYQDSSYSCSSGVCCMPTMTGTCADNDGVCTAYWSGCPSNRPNSGSQMDCSMWERCCTP